MVSFDGNKQMFVTQLDRGAVTCEGYLQFRKKTHEFAAKAH